MGDNEQITHVWTSRSQPRDTETGEIAFDISFNVGTDKESWSRVPITALMDLTDQTVAHEEVAEAINDWVEVAKQHPFVRRNCICCRRRATKGKILCGPCKPKYGSTIEAEECIDPLRLEQEELVEQLEQIEKMWETSTVAQK